MLKPVSQAVGWHAGVPSSRVVALGKQASNSPGVMSWRASVGTPLVLPTSGAMTGGTSGEAFPIARKFPKKDLAGYMFFRKRHPAQPQISAEALLQTSARRVQTAGHPASFVKTNSPTFSMETSGQNHLQMRRATIRFRGSHDMMT